MAHLIGPDALVRDFDLNVEKVLADWTVAFALRELIANALDEATLSRTEEPVIERADDGAWHIRDGGRGLRYQHLTQNESEEKKKNAGRVIGKFGVGLKDALATLHRKQIGVTLESRYGVITTRMAVKANFEDMITLQATVAPARDSAMVGTDVRLEGVADADMVEAKSFFLHFSGEQELFRDEVGQILQRSGGRAFIYVSGLRVAEEENFLFSYNITAQTSALRKALNRERTAVGRTAYSERVKTLLLHCRGGSVITYLTDDLSRFSQGRMHDELSWKDVAIHACRALSSSEKVVFVSGLDLAHRQGGIDRARRDGYRTLQVPEDIASTLAKTTDFDGAPVRILLEFITRWNQSFEFDWVEEQDLSEQEQAVWALKRHLFGLLQKEAAKVRETRISNSMRLDKQGHETVGLWEASERRIIVKRDHLRKPEDFAGTLLHELAHAISGADDVSGDFERGLTDLLGRAGAALGERLQESDSGEDTESSPTKTVRTR